MGQKQAGRRRRARRMDPVQALSEDTGPRWGRGGFLPAPPSVVDSTGPGRPAHAPGLPCTRASLGRGENGAETRAGPGGPALCARSCVCPEQCLILLPLASVCLDSTKRRPWGGDLALWRRQRWYLGLAQPYQHLPSGLADRWHLLAFAPTRWLLSLRGLCVRAALLSCSVAPPPLPGPGLCLLPLS